jgi:hypothetical protein
MIPPCWITQKVVRNQWRVVIRVPVDDPAAAAEVVASSNYFKPAKKEPPKLFHPDEGMI